MERETKKVEGEIIRSRKRGKIREMGKGKEKGKEKEMGKG